MKKWGPGIPEYSQSDLMTEEEKLDFAMQVVNEYEFKPNGYKIVAANNNPSVSPNFVVEKAGKLYFIKVGVAIAPDMPTLTDAQRVNLYAHAQSHKAECYFAPVGFGASDSERFDASLALRGDAFYANYVGLEKIEC